MMKKLLSLLCIFGLLLSVSACNSTNSDESDDSTVTTDSHTIVLNGDSATIDGETIEEFDYTWCVDPSTVHDEVSNAPAEYHTGTKPETDAIAYIDHDLAYMPELDESLFTLVNYDGEQEWAYYYQDGENNDYIFCTLPNLNKGTIPSEMMHSAEEAAQNKVLHITEAGTYVLEGTWNGQVLIDLGDGDENFTDETKKVTVILNGVDITCTVAPGIIFADCYECDNTWEDKESYPSTIDTTDAGVNVIIADDTDNTVTGQNIFRMLKTKYKDDDSTDAVKVQKKVRKIDAAFYSYQSMNIDGGDEGTGTLTVTSSFEGLDSELHLTFNGGNITINSQDDGINCNEDDVSIISFFGGNITINAAQGAEGDGVDSNGFVVIDGSNLYINNVKSPDNAVDSEDGITFTSGTVTIDGTLYETTETSLREINGSNQGMNMGGKMDRFNFDDSDFDIDEFKEKVAALSDDATLEDVLELLGMNNQRGEMPQGDMGQGNMGQGNFDPNNAPDNSNMPTPPDQQNS